MKGILFKPDMIKAIREGRKTQTRRVIKPQPERGVVCKCPGDDTSFANFEMYQNMQTKTGWIPIGKTIKPRYQVGEAVYIKEAWAVIKANDDVDILDMSQNSGIFYKFGENRQGDDNELDMERGRWRSPLFMPEWAARTFIKITDVRPERLQEITQDDAFAEGVTRHLASTLGLSVSESEEEFNLTQARRTYEALWDSINPKFPWNMNCWVWRYCFEKVEGK